MALRVGIKVAKMLADVMREGDIRILTMRRGDSLVAFGGRAL